MSADKIMEEMRRRKVKFDLSGDFYISLSCLTENCRTLGTPLLLDEDTPAKTCYGCGKANYWKSYGRKWVFANVDQFWLMLETTNDVKVPIKFKDWIVGQELAIKKTRMELMRWVEKEKTIQNMKKKGIDPSGMLKERPGPYVLFISEPGTGKSLLIKIIAEEMEELYKEAGIELSDVLIIENKMDRYRPMVREVPAGVGQRLVAQAERGALNEQKDKQQLMLTFLLVLIGIGGALVSTALFMMGVTVMQYGMLEAWFLHSNVFLGWMIVGMPLLVFPMMIMAFRGMSMFGVNQKDLLNVPHLIVDNGPGRKLVVNATVSNAPTLAGDIKWNAFGDTPGLTPPLHTRVVAGDIHKASDKLLYIDEIRNLQTHLAIEMLTVMEDGEAPIRAHAGGGQGNSESSAILAIATHDPVPANFMLIAAGNMDLLYNPASIINQVPAFRDRFNYGDIIYFETHMDATLENEVKIVQVLTDEIYRFGLKPVNKAGLRRIVEYMRSRAENNTRFKVMWRYVIKVLMKSYELALIKAEETNHDPAGVIVDGDDVDLAINLYCQSIEQQALTEHLENRRFFKLMPPVDTPEYGVVKGLAVVGNAAEGRSAGASFPVVAQIFPTDNPLKADFKVTGTTKDAESWIVDSRQHVRAAIMKLYGLDIEKDAKTFISFAQQKGVEGPSAGVAMTLALMSLLGDPRLPEKDRKPVPIRQDVAVTGTIELIPDPTNKLNVRVGSIGGVPDKVQGAADVGCRYVIVPMENFKYTLTREKYPCKIFGADSILGYFDLIRGDENSVIEAIQMKGPPSKEELDAWVLQRQKRKAVV
jgi:lon-related putative ATP-dependent protease